MRIRLLAALLLGAAAPSALAGAADVPVRSVSLFSSGVGYFEHAGTVTGDGVTELRFKTSQINDVLKSLVLQDLDGGRPSAVTYASQDPLAKLLKSFQVDVTSNPSQADLLNQLRGARVTVGLGTERLSGIVLGVELRQRPVGDKGNLANLPYLNLVTPSSVRPVALDEVRELTLDEPRLQEELAKALAALAQARDQDKKPVTVQFQGKGERRVRLGYVVETPVWKTSYRLVLPAAEAAEKPSLQGWAIVENQTESDWNDVQLSLVSGRPLSFVQDLYQPLYVVRPVVRNEVFAGLRPPSYEGGVQSVRDAEAFGGLGAEKKERLARKALAYESNAPAPAPAVGMALASSPRAEPPLDAAASVTSLAATAKLGELFQYTVGSVSLSRQKSALFPIVADAVEAERVSLYNAGVLPRNPLTGARLKNTTGKHLLQGPVTVLDSGGYGGDARLEDLPPGQERFLSYGVDLQVTVDAASNRQEETVQSAKIVKGILWVSKKHVSTQEYAAQNKADKDKVLIVEHPLRPGWKLVEPAKPLETTDTVYRFRLPVAAGKGAKLLVREEVVQEESYALLPGDPGQVVWYGKNGKIPKGVRDALTKAAQLKQALVDADREVDKRTRAVEEIGREQNRIRENMRTVSSGTAYYNRLVSKLNEQETQVEKLQTERDQLGKKRDGQQRALEDYLENLTVEN